MAGKGRQSLRKRGPKTLEGRQAVRFNALTHGLTAKKAPKDADPDAQARLSRLLSGKYLDPVSARQLAEEILEADARVRAVRQEKRKRLDTAMANPKTYVRLSWRQQLKCLEIAHAFYEGRIGSRLGIAAWLQVTGQIPKEEAHQIDGALLSLADDLRCLDRYEQEALARRNKLICRLEALRDLYF